MRMPMTQNQLVHMPVYSPSAVRSDALHDPNWRPKSILKGKSSYTYDKIANAMEMQILGKRLNRFGFYVDT
jgi:hypothetical protein